METFPWLGTVDKPLAVPVKTPAYAKKVRKMAAHYASQPAKTLKIPALVKDLVLASDKTCCLCQSASSTMVNRLVPQNLGGTNSFDNMIGCCRPCTEKLAGRPVADSGLNPVFPQRYTQPDAKPTWVAQLPMLLILSDTQQPTVGTVLFGYRVSTSTGRIRFDAVSITVPHRSNRPSIALEELPVHLYPKRTISTLASLSIGKLTTIPSPLDPPQSLIDFLPEVAQAFPQTPDTAELAKFGSGWKAISDSPTTVPLISRASTKVAPLKARALPTDSKEAKLQRHRALQSAIAASQAMLKKRRAIPRNLTKYVPPVPHGGNFLLIEDFWKAEKYWRGQFDAIWMIPTIPTIGMLVPTRLRANPPSKEMRDQILKADQECRYCLEAKATTLDHIFPRCFGGESTFENLVGACESCNGAKDDQLLPIEGMTLHLPERFNNPGAKPSPEMPE